MPNVTPFTWHHASQTITSPPLVPLPGFEKEVGKWHGDCSLLYPHTYICSAFDGCSTR